MKFKKLSVLNIGLLKGNWEFNLDLVVKEKPIILFGGLNGSGKTTIFDSIKLCLYGKDIFNKISKDEYLNYLKDKIHNSTEKNKVINSASVSLEFEYSKFGVTNNYSIRRYWEVKDNQVIETLIVKKDDLNLDNIESENWQDFIKELIPPGLTNLFFFDGEKIQKIIDDDNNIEFKNSVNSLLGFNIIDRLSSDLKMVKSKKIKDVSNKKHKTELSSLELEIDEILTKINEKRNKTSEMENHIEKSSYKLSNYEDKINAQGIQYLHRRDELLINKISKEKELEMIKDEIRLIIAGHYPILVSKRISKNLREKLILEENKKKVHYTKELLNQNKSKLIENFTTKMQNNKNIKLNNSKLRNQLVNILSDEIDEVFNLELKDDVKTQYNLSSKQTHDIVSNIDSALSDLPDKINRLFSDLEKKTNEIRNIYSDISKVPDDEFIRPMIRNYNEYKAKSDKLILEKVVVDNEIKQLENNLDDKERKLKVIKDKMIKSSKDILKLDYIDQTENVLKKYKQSLTEKRMEVLKNEFVEIFNKLHRKKDLINRISIDYNTFDLELFDKNNNSINKNYLSSGEKEIYAFSLLYALAKTSGQNLPFIIDTPLGRLDSSHRDNIVKNFFPSASEQMIIFSTNTEIDMENFKLLKKNISRNYNINFSNSTRCSEAKEGYFWS